ncbi:MAG: ABC transporter ATP-binding protein [Hyphomicrobiaceae bacterium]
MPDITAAGTGVPALEISHVNHSFGAHEVLKDVSLNVPRGAMVVLLGLNGAGKSTLFALITRLYDNVTGSIKILGEDVRRRPTVALQRLGVVFQSRTLDPDLSVTQNLTYHAALHGLSGREARARAARSLEIVGLTDKADTRVRTLSGGQARRVEIARSLLHRPNVLLLDEATVGLDIGSRETVLGIVRKLAAEEGMGVLWATHLIDEVAAGDLVVVLHKGHVMFTGTVPEFLAKTGGSTLSIAFRIITGTEAKAESAG